MLTTPGLVKADRMMTEGRKGMVRKKVVTFMDRRSTQPPIHPQQTPTATASTMVTAVERAPTSREVRAP